jgi:integrase
VTLAQAVEQFVARYKPKTTKDAYRRALARYFTAGELATVDQVKAVTPEDLPKVVRRLGGSPATVKHTFSVAKSFYAHLRAEDRSVVDPTVGFKTASIGDNVPSWNVLHPGDPAEVLALITDAHDRAVFLALLLQGWRCSELCTMTWGHLRKEKDGRWVVEWKGKRNRQRVQGLQPAVLEAVRALGGAVKPNAPLLITAEGKAWTRNTIYAVITKYAKLAGKHLSPHGLRATYISSVISRKGIEAARQLAGHTNITTTQRYSRWVVTRDDDLDPEDM